MVKIQDIAKATGYSTTTVSKALNNYTDISDKAKKTILATAKEYGYIPNAHARGLVMKRSFTVGVILDELLGLGLNHPFFSGIIEAFRASIEERGYSMILISNHIGNTGVGSYLDHCQQQNVDGVFILCTDHNSESIQQLIHSSIPVVLFDIPNEDTHSVVSNHFDGAYQATMYLVELGHSDIAHIYGNEFTYAGRERKKGYEKALFDANIEINEEYVVSGGYFDFKYGKLAMDQLVSLASIPTAVFIAGDIMALGAMQCCYEHGIRIPEDISIIGFDNIKLLDWITPSLTTVAQDAKKIGSECSRVLIDSIGQTKEEFTHKVISTHIIERKSCAPYHQV
jgi:LacI family transcriptional regulator